METDYMSIIPVKCDCCGKMVGNYSDRSEWFGKYLRPDESKICPNCIKGREGYAEEFLEKTGVELMKDDIQLTPRQCECWSCKANRGATDAEADVIGAMEEGYKAMATCTCHIDDGPACPVHSVRDDVCPACQGTGRVPYEEAQ